MLLYPVKLLSEAVLWKDLGKEEGWRKQDIVSPF